MAGSNNENDISEITNLDESAIMNSLEVHSTPNVGQDNKIELNVTDEINITDDSGIQITPKSNRENNKSNDDEVSFTDNNTDNTESQLTPVQNKKPDDSY